MFSRGAATSQQRARLPLSLSTKHAFCAAPFVPAWGGRAHPTTSQSLDLLYASTWLKAAWSNPAAAIEPGVWKSGIASCTRTSPDVLRRRARAVQRPRPAGVEWCGRAPVARGEVRRQGRPERGGLRTRCRSERR